MPYSRLVFGRLTDFPPPEIITIPPGLKIRQTTKSSNEFARLTRNDGKPVVSGNTRSRWS